MSLQRLARELDETARQTAGMVEGVTQALELLADKSIAPDVARREAARIIVGALQGQDRIEQQTVSITPGTGGGVGHDPVFETVRRVGWRTPAVDHQQPRDPTLPEVVDPLLVCRPVQHLNVHASTVELVCFAVVTWR